MIIKHKSNKSFMFYTSGGIKKFHQGKCEVNKQELEEVKKTLDYKNGMIEIEEEVKKEVKTKSKKRK